MVSLSKKKEPAPTVKSLVAGETTIVSLKSQPEQIAAALFDKLESAPQPGDAVAPQSVDFNTLSEREKVALRKKRFKFGDAGQLTTAAAQDVSLNAKADGARNG